MSKIKLSDYSNSIMDLVHEGYKPKQIANKLKLNPVSVNSWLRTNHPELSFRPNPGNVHYFDIIDSYAKAYILGFIAADGALVKANSSSTSLTITIKYEDKEILEFIKAEIGSEASLREINRESSFDNNKFIRHIRYTNSNKELITGIMKWGIGDNKSLSMGNILSKIPYDYRDAFIIGYFDGDGSVTVRNGLYPNDRGCLCKDNSLYIQIRGTESFFIGVCEHLNIDPSHIHKNDSIPNLTFASKKDTMRFYKCYKHLPFYLKRKHDKFLERINLPCYDKYR